MIQITRSTNKHERGGSRRLRDTPAARLASGMIYVPPDVSVNCAKVSDLILRCNQL